MRSARTTVVAATAAVLLWPGTHALASVTDPAVHTFDMPEPGLLAAVAPEAPASSPDVFAGSAAPVASDRLESIRGGAEVVVNDMRLDGSVANNTANRVITGSNAISDGAFANASGLPTVIQNSGANVLIQNATILNVRFAP